MRSLINDEGPNGRPDSAESMTSAEFAEVFGVRPETLRRWVREGLVSPSFRTPGGHLRFSRSDAAALLLGEGRPA